MTDMQTEAREPSTSKRYAVPEDWPKFQDVIVRLYVEENKTLEEVRQFMEEHHDFVATVAMYKRQLASWNAFKNLRFDEVLQILRLKKQRDVENKASVFFVRERKVEIDSLQMYISRNPSLYAKLESGEEPHPDAIRDVSCRTPTPPEALTDLPKPQGEAHDKAPEAIPRPTSELQEDLKQSLKAYISRSFESGLWVRSERYCWTARGHQGPTELLKSLLDRCMTAALSVGRQVEPAAIRHALDAPFSLLIRVFRDPPPDMIPRLLCIAARLEYIGRKEIQNILLQFCSDLARALYNPTHPLSHFWQTLLEVPLAERNRAIENVLTQCVSGFEEHLGPSHSLTAEVYLLYFDAVERRKDPATQVESLARKLSIIDQRVITPPIFAVLRLEYALATCKSNCADGQLDKADDALSQLDVTALSPQDEAFRCVWLGYIRWMKGEVEKAEKSYEDAVQAAKLTKSRDCICEALFQLERFYLHIQKPLEAEGIRAERLNGLRKLDTIIWTDHRDILSANDPETGPTMTIVRIGSDATSETWTPSASGIMIEDRGLSNQVSTSL